MSRTGGLSSEQLQQILSILGTNAPSPPPQDILSGKVTYIDDKQEWILDSGASHHMCATSSNVEETCIPLEYEVVIILDEKI